MCMKDYWVDRKHSEHMCILVTVCESNSLSRKLCRLFSFTSLFRWSFISRDRFAHFFTLSTRSNVSTIEANVKLKVEWNFDHNAFRCLDYFFFFVTLNTVWQRVTIWRSHLIFLFPLDPCKSISLSLWYSSCLQLRRTERELSRLVNSLSGKEEFTHVTGRESSIIERHQECVVDYSPESALAGHATLQRKNCCDRSLAQPPGMSDKCNFRSHKFPCAPCSLILLLSFSPSSSLIDWVASSSARINEEMNKSLRDKYTRVQYTFVSDVFDERTDEKRRKVHQWFIRHYYFTSSHLN